jgi:uncharacterized iron-regulated membrane protein
MSDLIIQISNNSVQLSLFLFFFALAMAGLAWSIVAFARLFQLQIATNVAITREISAIQHALAAPIQPGVPQATAFVPSSEQSPAAAPVKRGKIPKMPEGEIILPTDSDLADQETIRNMRTQSIVEQGMSDESLQQHIEELRQQGFPDERV